MSSTFYLYSAVVSRGGRNSIAPTSASPVRYTKAIQSTISLFSFLAVGI